MATERQRRKPKGGGSRRRRNSRGGGSHNGNNRRGRRNTNNRGQNDYYAPHLQPDAITAALSAGELLSGKLRVNSKKRDQSFVTVKGISCDIFIASDKSRNRALDGDMVALRLVSTAGWKDLSSVIGHPSAEEAGSSTTTSARDDDEAALKAEDEVRNLWRPLVPESWDFAGSADAADADSSEAKT